MTPYLRVLRNTVFALLLIGNSLPVAYAANEDLDALQDKLGNE